MIKVSWIQLNLDSRVASTKGTQNTDPPQHSHSLASSIQEPTDLAWHLCLTLLLQYQLICIFNWPTSRARSDWKFIETCTHTHPEAAKHQRVSLSELLLFNLGKKKKRRKLQITSLPFCKCRSTYHTPSGVVFSSQATGLIWRVVGCWQLPLNTRTTDSNFARTRQEVGTTFWRSFRANRGLGIFYPPAFELMPAEHDP